MFADQAFGREFFNVTHRVSGSSGDFEDVKLVKILLKFVFIQDPTMKRFNPVKGDIDLTGKPNNDLHLLIAAYQKHAMKRPKPEGFINKAVGNDTGKMLHTICHLNFHCQGVIAAVKPGIKTVRNLIILALNLDIPHPKIEVSGTAGSISVQL